MEKENGNIKAEGIKEDYSLSPINPYGQSKLFSEKIIQDVGRTYGLKYVILRYFNVAGTSPDLTIGQKTKNTTHLIKVTAECAVGKRQKRCIIFGNDCPTWDGTCVKDYIHVMDLAEVNIQALDYLDKNPSDVFYVGYGRGASVKEVIETMKKVSEVDFKVDIAPPPSWRPGYTSCG